MSVITALPFWVVYLAYRRIITAKLEDAQGLLASEKTFNLYKRVFGYSMRETISSDPAQRRSTIKAMFQRYYNDTAYLIAVGVLTFACFVFAASGLAILLVSSRIPVPLPSYLIAVISAIPRASIAAFWGAYVWSLYEVILRYRDHDFTPVSAHLIWVKFLASSAVAGFIATVLPASVALLAGFCIGSLLLPELLNWTRNKAKELLRSKQGASQTERPTLQLLQGATSTVVSRLAEVGIESIHHLAYADPFSLLFQTNFRWTTILDFIDQALLFNYLGESTIQLYSSGIRGAIELAALSEPYQENDQTNAAERADQVIIQLAERLQIHETQMHNLVECLAEDYQVSLLADLFAEAFGEDVLVEDSR